MLKQRIDFLRQLTETIGPSGMEDDVARLWQENTSKYCVDSTRDAHGNTIFVKGVDNNMRVMLAAHADEIGYMVKYIDDEGFIYFAQVGGLDRHLIPGRQVSIVTKKGVIIGAIGKKATHLQDADEEKKLMKTKECWVDIGVKNKKEAEKIVSVGDYIVPNVKFENIRGDIYTSKAFDDRAGMFVINEVFRLLKGKKINCQLYGVATVQEEIGLRGAKTSAYGIKPHVGIAIDVTHASDNPGSDKKYSGEIKLGAGPSICTGPNITPQLFDALCAVAKKNKIPYQIEADEGVTGTDAAPIQVSRMGVATGLISIPLRYMHTPVEMVHLSDIENAAKLLAAFVEGDIYGINKK